MQDFTAADNKDRAKPHRGHSAGGALRHEILNKITPILAECNVIGESGIGLLIQAYCLDVVTGLEDVIQAYGLDDYQLSK